MATKKTNNDIERILLENDKRNQMLRSVFNPLTGEGAILERTRLEIPDFAIPVQLVPSLMMDEPFIRALVKCGTIEAFQKNADGAASHELLSDLLVRIRCKYDFCFWAYMFARIKNKEGGEDVPFLLNRPQRRLVELFESMRIAGQPIRTIVLKARQWGGSTVTQIYMSWIQLIHKKGWNSLIVGHTKDSSTEVKGMLFKLLESYPMGMLYPIGETPEAKEPKFKGDATSTNIFSIPARNCKVKLGTAIEPNSARGGDSALVHCTEVAFWKKTEGKTPQEIVRTACAGAGLMPLTMIVYESTANGTGNFFQTEYDAAKAGRSSFKSIFVAWWQIEKYALPIDNVTEFSRWLWDSRNNDFETDNRHECGRYLWWLWEQGATLEAINWYIQKRAEYELHGDMAAEYPSDDVEAFQHTGAAVFDKYRVMALKPSCRPPAAVGDVYGDGDEGKTALQNVRFVEDSQGRVCIWEMPEILPEQRVRNRYLTVVDVGGRSSKADFSVIVVFDRYWMMETNGKPVVVAQWYGHIDHDLLAWKAAQIAAFYDNSLLVIESNTLETKDRDRIVDGDQSVFILTQIKNVYNNLYARKQSEIDIREGRETKYGFHTNVQTKPMIISTLVKVVREAMYIERDEQCLNEYLTYERKQNGSYGAEIGKHDDLLMTRAIGLHICFFEMERPTISAIRDIYTSPTNVNSLASL